MTFMSDVSQQIITHFSMFHYRDLFYTLPPADRQAFHTRLWGDLQSSSSAVFVYQVYPLQSGVDFLVWSSQLIERPDETERFFERLACAALPHRQLIETVQTFWGFTRPSQYTKSRSSQEIDPFTPERKRYLILYPFVKTADWYLLGQETRQGIMNGHIKVGKQYPQITQLLLYSFGLQDQEFVVVYETDDLASFSNLVYALRDTEARRYTQRDTPLYTALFHPGAASLALWE
jgi:chlorite dismutase